MDIVSPVSTFKLEPVTFPERNESGPPIRGHINALAHASNNVSTIDTVFGKYFVINDDTVYLLNKEKTTLPLDNFKSNIVAAERTLKILDDMLFVDEGREEKLKPNFAPFGGKSSREIAGYLNIDGTLATMFRLTIGEKKHEIFNFNPALDILNNITKFMKLSNTISRSLAEVRDFKEHQYDKAHSSTHMVTLYFSTLTKAVEDMVGGEVDVLEALSLAEVMLNHYELSYRYIRSAYMVLGENSDEVRQKITQTITKIEDFPVTMFSLNNDLTIMLKKLNTLALLVKEQDNICRDFMASIIHSYVKDITHKPMSLESYCQFVDYISGNELEDFIWDMPSAERYETLKIVLDCK